MSGHSDTSALRDIMKDLHFSILSNRYRAKKHNLKEVEFLLRLALIELNEFARKNEKVKNPPLLLVDFWATQRLLPQDNDLIYVYKASKIFLLTSRSWLKTNLFISYTINVCFYIYGNLDIYLSKIFNNIKSALSSTKAAEALMPSDAPINKEIFATPEARSKYIGSHKGLLRVVLPNTQSSVVEKSTGQNDARRNISAQYGNCDDDISSVADKSKSSHSLLPKEKRRHVSVKIINRDQSHEVNGAQYVLKNKTRPTKSKSEHEIIEWPKPIRQQLGIDAYGNSVDNCRHHN